MVPRPSSSRYYSLAIASHPIPMPQHTTFVAALRSGSTLAHTCDSWKLPHRLDPLLYPFRTPLIYTGDPQSSLDHLHADAVRHYRMLSEQLGEHERRDLTTDPPPLLTGGQGYLGRLSLLGDQPGGGSGGGGYYSPPLRQLNAPPPPFGAYAAASPSVGPGVGAGSLYLAQASGGGGGGGLGGFGGPYGSPHTQQQQYSRQYDQQQRPGPSGFYGPSAGGYQQSSFRGGAYNGGIGRNGGGGYAGGVGGAYGGRQNAISAPSGLSWESAGGVRASGFTLGTVRPGKYP